MIKFKKKLQWIWDYYIAYILYNRDKLKKHFDYMYEKYPNKFEECVDRDY